MKYRHHRYPTRYKTTFKADGRDCRGVMVSISDNGAKVQIKTPLAVGQKVVFALPTGPAGATVKWKTDTQAGFEFDCELSIAAVDLIRFKMQASRGRTHHAGQFSVMR